MNINKVLLTGNPTANPELVKAGSTNVVNVTLANNERFLDDEGQEREITTFADVKIWGKQAENFARLASTKTQIFVEGQLRTESWEKDGQKRSKLIVKADRWQFTQYKRSDEAPSDEPKEPNKPKKSK
jgi:single-strand DNA-binding protein